jgi:hypothetical protein
MLCDQKLESPLTLDCGHALCTPCVETQKAFFTLKNLRTTEANEHITIECPACKFLTVVDDIASLPQYKVESKVPCFNTKCSNEATCECTICAKYCCDGCFDKLHALIGEHEKSTIGVTQKYKCPEHDRVIEFYCNTCLESLCSDCILKHDRNHGITSATELSKTKNKLQENKTTMDVAISEIECTAAKLDEQSQQAILKIEQDYETALNELKMRREQTLSQVEKTRHVNLVSTQKQVESIRQVMSHIDRLESTKGTSAIRKWDIINRLQPQLSTVPLAPQMSQGFDKDTHHTYGVISAPTVSTYPEGITISWNMYPDASTYRLRMILKSKEKTILMLVTPNSSISVYADSSYGQKGVVIYEGTSATFSLNAIQYNVTYTFTVECIDKNGRSYMTSSSEPLILTAPKMKLAVIQMGTQVSLEAIALPDLRPLNYSLSWKPLDNQSQVANLRPDIVGKYYITSQVIGKYYQYQIQGTVQFGPLIPSNFSPPVLCTQAVLVAPTSAFNFGSQQSFMDTNIQKIDIFEYLRRCKTPVQITSSSNDNFNNNPNVIGGVGPTSGFGANNAWGSNTADVSFSTLSDTSGPWVQFDFSSYSVCVTMFKNFNNMNGEIEGSNDGATWELIAMVTTNTGTFTFGGASPDVVSIASNVKYYSLLRIKALPNEKLTLGSNLAMYGTIRVPFVLSNKFGEMMFQEKLHNKFTDTLIYFEQ